MERKGTKGASFASTWLSWFRAICVITHVLSPFSARCQPILLSSSVIMRCAVATKEWTPVIICSEPVLRTSWGGASRGAISPRVSVDPSPSTQMFFCISSVNPIRYPRQGGDFTAALCISYIKMRRAMCALLFLSFFVLLSCFAITLNGWSSDTERLPSCHHYPRDHFQAAAPWWYCNNNNNNNGADNTDIPQHILEACNS